MKDHDTLKANNIKDGLTIHLVIKAAQRTADSGPSRPAGLYACYREYIISFIWFIDIKYFLVLKIDITARKLCCTVPSCL